MQEIVAVVAQDRLPGHAPDELVIGDLELLFF